MAAIPFSFIVNGREVRLPVTPSSYSWGTAQGINSVDVDGLGSVNLPGTRQAHSDNIACMFPAARYPFCGPGAVTEPRYYIDLFTRLVREKQVVRYIVGDRVNARVLIDEFTYREQNGTRDVYATIYLAEYIPLDAVTTQTTAAAGDTENYAREAEPETDTQTYTVAAGDCLSVICRRFYGYGTPAYYNAVAKYNGIKNPHLIYPGQVLTIPPTAQLGVT